MLEHPFDQMPIRCGIRPDAMRILPVSSRHLMEYRWYMLFYFLKIDYYNNLLEVNNYL